MIYGIIPDLTVELIGKNERCGITLTLQKFQLLLILDLYLYIELVFGADAVGDLLLPLVHIHFDLHHLHPMAANDAQDALQAKCRQQQPGKTTPFGMEGGAQFRVTIAK